MFLETCRYVQLLGAKAAGNLVLWNWPVAGPAPEGPGRSHMGLPVFTSIVFLRIEGCYVLMPTVFRLTSVRFLFKMAGSSCFDPNTVNTLEHYVFIANTNVNHLLTVYYHEGSLFTVPGVIRY